MWSAEDATLANTLEPIVPGGAMCQLSVLYVDPSRENSIKILHTPLFGICCPPYLVKISGSPTF